MGINLLDEGRFGLRIKRRVSRLFVPRGQVCRVCSHTCTLALHSDVIEEILADDTPGGFNSSIEVRMPSSSATQDDMMTVIQG